MNKSKNYAIMTEIIKAAHAEYYEENSPPTWKKYNFDKTKGVRYMANVMNTIRMFKPLPNEIKAAEIGMILACARFIEAETGMLYYRSDRDHKPVNVHRLAATLGMSVSHVYRFIHRMCKLRIMAREQGRIYVNPCYFFRGRFLSYHLYYLFKPELDQILPAWVVQRYETIQG